MKFADEKTQELFERFINGLENHLIRGHDDVISFFETSREMDAFISHVESRLRREAEPCEWEKYCKLGGYLQTPELINGIYTFCPACGRRLEDK